MGPVNSLGELVQERSGLTTEKYKSICGLVQPWVQCTGPPCALREILAQSGFWTTGGGFQHSGSHPS